MVNQVNQFSRPTHEERGASRCEFEAAQAEREVLIHRHLSAAERIESEMDSLQRRSVEVERAAAILQPGGRDPALWGYRPPAQATVQYYDPIRKGFSSADDVNAERTSLTKRYTELKALLRPETDALRGLLGKLGFKMLDHTQVRGLRALLRPSGCRIPPRGDAAPVQAASEPNPDPMGCDSRSAKPTGRTRKRSAAKR